MTRARAGGMLAVPGQRLRLERRRGPAPHCRLRNPLEIACYLLNGQQLCIGQLLGCLVVGKEEPPEHPHREGHVPASWAGDVTVPDQLGAQP